MADDPIRKYLNAQDQYHEATKKVEVMVGDLTEIAIHLRNWRTVVIGSCGGFPMDMMRAPDLDVRDHNWPQPQPLRQAMIDWHHAKRDMQNAWRQVPEKDQRGLRSPE